MTLEWQRVGHSSFAFVDPEYGVTLRLRNVRQEGGNTYGDVYAFQRYEEGGGDVKLLVRPHANLTGDRSLPGLVKSLVGRQPKYPWGDLLEDVCAALVEELDHKGQVTVLEPLTEADLAWPMLFKNFIPCDTLSGLAAHGGTGKSLTGAMMALAVATGQKIGPFEPLQTGVVIYLDWENQKGEGKLHRQRLTRICMGLGLEFPRGQIIHYGAGTSVGKSEEELLGLADKYRPVVWIVDSVGYASGGNLNDSDVAIEATNALKHLPGTVVMIAHVSKGSLMEGANTKLGATGSAFYWNGPQAFYELRATDPALDGSILLTLYQQKANVGAKLVRPLGCHVTFDDPAGPITPAPMRVQGHQEGGEGMSMTMRVMDALAAAREQVTAVQVAQMLFDNPDKTRVGTVERTLRELRDKGRVHSFGGKQGQAGSIQKWGLAAQNGHSAPMPEQWVPEDSEGSGDSLPEVSGSSAAFRCAKCGAPGAAYDDKGLPVCGQHMER